MPGDTQSSAGQCPELPALVHPALNTVVGVDVLQRCPPTSAAGCENFASVIPQPEIG